MLLKMILTFWSNFFLKIAILPIRFLIILLKIFNLKKKVRSTNFFLNSEIKEKFLKSFDNYEKIKFFEKKKFLNYIDVGSSGGPISEVNDNLDYFNRIILFDGNETKKDDLEKKGYEVINNFILDSDAEKVFYHIKWNPDASSIFKPGKEDTNNFFALYGGRKYLKDHQNYEEEKIKVYKSSRLIEKLNIDKIDLLKLDVQGSEELILKDIFESAKKNIIPYPLFIKCEIMFTPFYEKVNSGFEIISLITKNDYILVGYSDEHYRDNMPMWSDCIFMPNWNSDRGKKMIKKYYEEFKLLCRIYNKEFLYFFASKSIKDEELLK